MIIYPAIDIKEGQCVRLIQGDFQQTTVFNADPAAVAVRWAQMGAEYLHLVDLDGARHGAAYNDAVVKRILAAVSIPVQIGGGLRTLAEIENKLDMGISRVILGTAALENPALVREAVAKYGAHIAVGIDVVDEKVAIAGWQTVTQTDLFTLLAQMERMGVQTVICTDITKDGMLVGTNAALYKKLTAATAISVIASGGVSTLGDLDTLAETGVSGVIVGKALYVNAIDLQEAIVRYRRS